MLRGLTLCLITMSGLQIALAQTPTINATVYRDKVRFESREPIKEFRVEVFNTAGEKLFDSGFVAGGTLDWNMMDQQGEPVADGMYDYLVTTTMRGGKNRETQSSQLSLVREGRDLENAPPLVRLAAAGSGNGSGNVTGTGTAGQITKWTGTTTLGDSVLTEKDGKIGLGITNPFSLLHILGSHPATSMLAGTNATEGLRVIGGKGGDTSGSGQSAGSGANLVLQAGDGGDALTGTSGRGGLVTIQPGAAGVGSVSGGFGQVLLAPGGGNVGIGVTDAASKLTVAGMIETTLGGVKFPDGTTQTTAAAGGLTSIFHDLTLTGNGTSGSPLGVSNGGIGPTQLAIGAVTAAKIAPGQVVTGLNGLKDEVTLTPGSNIMITSLGSTLTVAAPDALSSIFHDTSLTGNGTSGSLLGLAIPLNLTGAVPTNVSSFGAVIKATNTADGGLGVTAFGGDSASSFGGVGVIAAGGSGASGGNGVNAFGGLGNSNQGQGGSGVAARGGPSNDHGGTGVDAQGGEGTFFGGIGVVANGGNHSANTDSNGGHGVFAIGGNGSGSGLRSGSGLVAQGGNGTNGASNGPAGDFHGDVTVSGNLSVTGTKNFKIDHPLDPENKYLYHAAIESSEVLNVYSGNIATDQDGSAVVILPEWFEAINRDFRYQLTVVGQFAQAIVASKIKNNRFKVKTNAPNVEVSWQVIGVRSDAALLKNPFRLEEDKADHERGYYLSPEAYGQQQERGVEWARHPEMMQRLKQRRIEAEQKFKQQQH